MRSKVQSGTFNVEAKGSEMASRARRFMEFQENNK